MQTIYILVIFCSLTGLSQAEIFNATLDEKDNPFATCFTNPCVQVEGVGKIMGSKKVSLTLP